MSLSLLKTNGHPSFSKDNPNWNIFLGFSVPTITAKHGRQRLKFARSFVIALSFCRKQPLGQETERILEIFAPALSIQRWLSGSIFR